jgi:hypothetical protein
MSYEPKPHELLGARRLLRHERGQAVYETDEEIRARLIRDHEVLYEQPARQRQEMIKAGAEKYRREQEAAEAEAARQRQAEADESMKADARSAYLATTAATEADFEKAWPAIRETLLQQRTVEALGAKKAGLSQVEALIAKRYPGPAPRTEE